MLDRGDRPLCEAVLAQVSSRVSGFQFQTWFQRVQFRKAGHGRVTVHVPNRFMLGVLSHRFLPVLTEAIETVTRIQNPKIQFEVPPAGDDGTAVANGATAVEGPRRAMTAPPAPPLPENLPLNPEFTFEQFVEGDDNRLALAACKSVADEPGASYNPLFIYGPVGLGKTHLMQAVAHEYIAQGKRRVVYLSCASFTNDFISAVSTNSVDRFRSKYRDADALLIDDIQFLANKERTQEEFFHTFNSAYNQQKQIFLTSDCLPSEIDGLGDRLVSRFKLGLVAYLDPPSFETRVAILMRKAEKLGLRLDPEVAGYVAQRIRDNVRELEGALRRMHSIVAIEHRPLTVAEVAEALADLIGHEERRIDLFAIQQLVVEEFKVQPADLHSKSRTRSVVLPRQVCMYLGRTHTRCSLGEIGLYFGGRDHTTALHAIEKIRTLIERDPRVRNAVNSIERRLGR